MTHFALIFDKITRGRYFLLLALVAVLFFGHGVYASYQDKRAEKTYRAEYAALASKIDNAKVGKTIQLRGKGFFVTRLNGVIGDDAFEENK